MPSRGLPPPSNAFLSWRNSLYSRGFCAAHPGGVRGARTPVCRTERCSPCRPSVFTAAAGPGLHVEATHRRRRIWRPTTFIGATRRLRRRPRAGLKTADAARADARPRPSRRARGGHRPSAKRPRRADGRAFRSVGRFESEGARGVRVVVLTAKARPPKSKDLARQRTGSGRAAATRRSTFTTHADAARGAAPAAQRGRHEGKQQARQEGKEERDVPGVSGRTFLKGNRRHGSPRRRGVIHQCWAWRDQAQYGQKPAACVQQCGGKRLRRANNSCSSKRCGVRGHHGGQPAVHAQATETHPAHYSKGRQGNGSAGAA